MTKGKLISAGSGGAASPSSDMPTSSIDMRADPPSTDMARDPGIPSDMAKDPGPVSEPAPGEISGWPVAPTRGVWNEASTPYSKGLSCEYNGEGAGGQSSSCLDRIGGVATGSCGGDGSLEMLCNGVTGGCCVGDGEAANAWSKMKKKPKSCKH